MPSHEAPSQDRGFGATPCLQVAYSCPFRRSTVTFAVRPRHAVFLGSGTAPDACDRYRHLGRLRDGGPRHGRPPDAYHPTQRPLVPKNIATHDFRGELIVLGSGTSVGVPAIGCGCDVCQSGSPRNQRTRCAIAVGLPEGNLLVDTPPDLRTQLLRERIGLIDSVVFTHEHADHIFGLDDLRLFQFYLGHAVPLYCTATVERRIRKSFDYAFTDEHNETHPGATPQLEFHPINSEPFDLLGTTIRPIPLKHGPRFDVLGFRFGNVAYCTDTSAIPAASWPLLAGLDVLILDALRWRPHPTHMNIEQALEVVHRVSPGQTYLTHVNHELDHEATNARLPARVALAYDGLRIRLT